MKHWSTLHYDEARFHVGSETRNMDLASFLPLQTFQVNIQTNCPNATSAAFTGLLTPGFYAFNCSGNGTLSWDKKTWIADCAFIDNSGNWSSQMKKTINSTFPQ